MTEWCVSRCDSFGCEACNFIMQPVELYSFKRGGKEVNICVKCLGCGNFKKEGNGLEILAAEASERNDTE